MPANYTWDSVHIRPVGNAVAAESDQIKLTRALGELGAENVGPGVVAKLYAAGYTTIGKIYAATQADIEARVEGCKARAAEKIWTGLRASQQTWTTLHFLCASCTMPRGVGSSKLQPLLAIEPRPSHWNAAALKAARPAGLSEATIDAIVDAVPAYLAWLADTKLTAATPTQTQTTAVARVSGGPTYTVVLTGFRDKALETVIAAAGHTVADSVTKKTSHVVYPDGPAPTSTKITKAQEIGAVIMSVSAFRSFLGF